MILAHSLHVITILSLQLRIGDKWEISNLNHLIASVTILRLQLWLLLWVGLLLVWLRCLHLVEAIGLLMLL